MAYRSNDEISRRVFRALKTPSDDDRLTDPMLAFRFEGMSDQILMRCHKTAQISIKGKEQEPGRVKFFEYSDFHDYRAETVLFELRDRIREIELYRRGAIEGMTFGSWGQFEAWLDSLDEAGVQISLKLPCLVYAAVRDRQPSMQNFIVESVKLALKGGGEGGSSSGREQ
jgi:hypothetical protein